MALSSLLLLLWMDTDARRAHRLPCYDFGFLATLTYPLSLVWYCLWSRGWRGILLLHELVLLLFAPWLVALALWLLRS
jgi:hypothetical protein